MWKVAIITRTKKRDLFLQRALNSISEQVYKDFIWVIVNDGGPVGPVDAVAEQARNSNMVVKVIHRKKSTGMEAASNQGICESESEYIVIHDDDDTWQSEFLYETVTFLDRETNYGGVISWNELVYEKIKDKRICTIKRKVQRRTIAITIADMLAHNPFPPIAFLYRRSAFERVSPYDETFPVCGDYEFNLRFIDRYDIGVIPKPMANHHFRTALKDKSDSNSNTEIAQPDLHLRYQAILRNRLFRRDLAQGKIGIGVLLQINAMHPETYRFLNKLYTIAKFLKLTKY
jgi:glycosyltransferase involved in cell wall biosynthesis